MYNTPMAEFKRWSSMSPCVARGVSGLLAFGVALSLLPARPPAGAFSTLGAPSSSLARPWAGRLTDRPTVSTSSRVISPGADFGLAGLAVLTSLGLARRRGVFTRGAAPNQGSMSLVISPKETYDTIVAKAEYLSKMSLLKTLHASVMGGAYVGMAGLLSLAIAGNIGSTAPGVTQLVFASLFPVNLLLVLQSGGQLFTGNTATMAMGLIEGKCNLKHLAKSWIVAYIGNVIGCGMLAIVASYTGLLTGATAELAVKTAIKKCHYTFGQTLVKAIMCNWLVCMAVWLATSAQDLPGKMVGIWFPISMFVAIGFEHSVANFFMLPAGLLAGAPLTISDVIFKNLIPVTIGNTIAGALIIGCGFSFAFGTLGQGDRGSFRGLGRLLTGRSGSEHR
ncbi:unnamed protein product [Polarella glacialis]|uniref:Uncharacterized protein n=1 Tax=Polarella glacialis TaxID=89957 RepID=A0A813JT08_POLGL|nr:unnamed protein product [Polarella glacialis]CAE8612624.1 unnamed protein product [Polarella glacialis]CAE8688082.1 unnamed protein product [Polarella glacialis]